ncbi:hypothetical protein IT415_01775 [bacterium]|nr:hypothetical protein [bacterium]
MSKITKQALIFFCFVNAVLFIFTHLPLNKARAVGTTLTVSSINDGDDANAGDGICETSTPGECTLRAAITESNANTGTDTIEFNISGGGVKTIGLTDELPAITEQIVIDGYTQTGASENTAQAPLAINSVITIAINGSTLGQNKLGLRVGGANSVIKGLSISGFDASDGQHGNLLISANNVQIKGCYIGADASGNAYGAGDNKAGIGVVNATGVEIGGINPADRNVVINNHQDYSATAAGIMVLPGSEAIIQGNIVGLGKDGSTDLGGYYGIILLGSNSQIGGSSNGEQNIVSGAHSAQILLISSGTVSGNVVQGNYVGPGAGGEIKPSIDSGAGIALVGAGGSLVDNLIGGDNQGEGNTIRAVKGIGIAVQEMNDPAPNKNAILGNSIYDIKVNEYFSDFTSINQGIDLFRLTSVNPYSFSAQGVTGNDINDTDTGANDYINSPTLRTAQQVNNTITITLDLDASDSPSNSYRIEFFANDEASVFGAGPGQEFIGSQVISPGSNQPVVLNVSGNYSFKSLSATTTAIDNTTSTGFGSTSEFARNISIGSAEDTDADGIINSVEDAAPNSGDTNDDSIADRLQPAITAFKSGDDSTWQTVMTSGCSENSSVSSLGPNAFPKQDANHNYPFGLTDFTLRCSKGDTANVTIYYFTDQGVDSLHPRKLLTGTEEYVDLPNATLQQAQLGGQNVLKLTYSIQDGSAFDDDGGLNGLIHDPVGLATNNANATLPTVGAPHVLLPVGLAILVTLIYAYYDYMRHKKPLVAENPHIHYTFWHHLRVVTLPIMKYRFSIVVERRDSAPIAS